MAYINDSGLDSVLTYVTTNGTRLDLCSTEPTSYAQATSTYTLANKTSGLSFGAPTDRTPNGRKVVLAAISTGGNCTGNGTAAFWALTNGSNLLVATGALSPSITIVSGASFTTTALDIGIADATNG
jgi:hypothetical protein